MKPAAPSPPQKPTVDRDLAKDVAKHLDRRRVRRRLLLWAALLGAIVLAVMYLTCGSGFGLGGAGKGAGSGAGPGSGSVAPLLSAVDAGPRRCEIRVVASGVTVDGQPATVAEAAAACKGAVAAEVLVTGGARAADRDALKAALDAAGVQILWVDPKAGSADGGSGGSGSAGSDG